MKITSGRLASVLVLLALGAGLVWSLMPKPVPVETAMVTRGRFVATVDEDGKASIRERYVVAAALGGRLTRIQLKVGDRVKAGEGIAAILPTPAPFLDPRSRREAEERLGALDAAQKRARAMVERAGAEAAQARSDLDRTRALVKRGVSTAQALERAELALRVSVRDLRAAEFQYDAADHELAQARALLARYTDGGSALGERWMVIAPVSGVVLRQIQESETIVQSGAPLIEIGDPRDLEIVTDVLSSDAVEIRPGAAVIIDHWGGPGTLAGKVRRVEPVAFTKISTLGVEEQRVNIRIDITAPPEQWSGPGATLGDGYQVDTRIIVFTQDPATIIPAGALFRRGDDWAVYVVESGRATLRPVTLTRRSGRLAAIASGLKPGEEVIVYPSDRVSAGVRVEARVE